MESAKKILTIGGGSGQFALLSGLRDLEALKISAVVSMVDSGGSTGRVCVMNLEFYRLETY